MLRTLVYSPKGRKHYAVWSAEDRFLKMVLYKTCHSLDIKKSSKAERAKKK